MSSNRVTTFYRIIHPDRLLGLPRKFVRDYGDDLRDTVSLKVPGDTPWVVELKRTDGGIHFHEGWHEFAEHYSISVGYFLVFNYDGSSQFNVLICDMTATEIRYKLKSVDCEEQNSVGQSLPVPAKKRKVSSPPSSYGLPLPVPAKKKNVSSIKCDTLPNHEGRPSFKVIMRPSYWQYLPIPSNFVKRCFTEQVESVTLISHGRSWELGCFEDDKGYRKLVKGWMNFRREVNLKIGDECVFQLMRVVGGNAVMKFDISH